MLTNITLKIRKLFLVFKVFLVSKTAKMTVLLPSCFYAKKTAANKTISMIFQNWGTPLKKHPNAF